MTSTKASSQSTTLPSPPKKPPSQTPTPATPSPPPSHHPLNLSILVHDHNVATIHTSPTPVPAATLTSLRTLADAHEWSLACNTSSPARAIAGAVLAASVLQSLNTTLLSPAAEKLTVQFGPYGTFMSLFGLAQLPAASGDFYGVVDYASGMMFELITDVDGVEDVGVWFRFVNGSAGAGNVPKAFPLFGRRETVLPWGDFVKEMEGIAVGSVGEWCRVCGNEDGVCVAAEGVVATGGGGSGVSKVVAGVIGAWWHLL